jgi:hypothetical protein
MIVTELYNGQGLGNQLWTYVVTRTIALDNKFEFGVQSPHKFKGYELFPELKKYIGKRVIGGEGPEGGPPITLPEGITNYYRENKISHPVWNCDISPLDLLMLERPDNTKFDGTMQSEDYILHRKNEIKQWLKLDPKYDIKDYSNENTCVINLRGTFEYRFQSELFLSKEYYYNAINYIKNNIDKNMKFIVVTDDIEISRVFFPDLDIYHVSLEWDYGVIHNAHYAILSNSSFAWFPIWTSHVNKLTIAPKYWARHNISDGFWSNGDSLTRDWLWLDREGRFYSYEKCFEEKREYKYNKDCI